MALFSVSSRLLGANSPHILPTAAAVVRCTLINISLAVFSGCEKSLTREEHDSEQPNGMKVCMENLEHIGDYRPRDLTISFSLIYCIV